MSMISFAFMAAVVDQARRGSRKLIIVNWGAKALRRVAFLAFSGLCKLSFKFPFDEEHGVPSRVARSALTRQASGAVPDRAPAAAARPDGLSLPAAGERGDDLSPPALCSLRGMRWMRDRPPPNDRAGGPAGLRRWGAR